MPMPAGSHAGRAVATLLALGIPIALFVALIAVVDRDPAGVVTASRSPYSDEAWSVMNARNLVRLGDWAPDGWHLYFVNLPFSLIEAGVFRVLGVGIVQARLVSVVATVTTAALLATGLRRPFGRIPALLAGCAFAASSVVLFYGDLAIMEPLVATFLTAAVLLVVRLGGGHDGRIGCCPASCSRWRSARNPMPRLPRSGSCSGSWLAAELRAASSGAGRSGRARALPHARSYGWRRSGSRTCRTSAADVRIWPAQRLPRSIGDLVYSVAHYPFSSDGAITGVGPVALAGIAGAVGSIAGWRRLNPAARRLIGAAIGWLVAGGIPLLILNYHPKPVRGTAHPALSILLAAGASIVWRASQQPASRRAAGAAALLAIVLVVPGAVGYAGRFTTTGRTLVEEQATFERIVPAGAVMEGDFAPLFAMRTGAQTIVSWPHAGVNNADEYADRHVRWLLIAPGEPPAWVALHPVAWAARQRVLCLTWGRTRLPVLPALISARPADGDDRGGPRPRARSARSPLGRGAGPRSPRRPLRAGLELRHQAVERMGAMNRRPGSIETVGRVDERHGDGTLDRHLAGEGQPRPISRLAEWARGASRPRNSSGQPASDRVHLSQSGAGGRAAPGRGRLGPMVSIGRLW